MWAKGAGMRWSPGVFALALSCGFTGSDAAPGFAYEIVVRTAETLHNAADVHRLVDDASAAGVSGISVLVKQDEDKVIASGETYYPSAVAPRATGYETFDVLASLIPLAHRKGIRVRAWIPQFHDQVAALAHPAWAMQSFHNGHLAPYQGNNHREYFVNPLDRMVQDYELSIIAEVVSHYDVDGVMLDWLRFDDFNMDLGSQTREHYRALRGVDPLDIDFSVDSAERAAWNAFREDGLAEYVTRVRLALPSSVSLGAFILPPEFVEVGQDASRFRQALQVVAPMCYSYDWGFALDWITDRCLADTVDRAGPVEVAPTLDSHLSESDHLHILQAMHQKYPMVHTVFWFYHDTWTRALLQHVNQVSAPLTRDQGRGMATSTENPVAAGAGR
jgi:hypothetical protein